MQRAVSVVSSSGKTEGKSWTATLLKALAPSIVEQMFFRIFQLSVLGKLTGSGVRIRSSATRVQAIHAGCHLLVLLPNRVDSCRHSECGITHVFLIRYLSAPLAYCLWRAEQKLLKLCSNLSDVNHKRKPHDNKAGLLFGVEVDLA